MFEERLSDLQVGGLQRLLVIQLDAAETVEAALAVLQEQRPDLTLIPLDVLEDSGLTTRYVLPGAVSLTVYDQSPQATIQWIQDQRVDGAIVFAARGQSPYAWVYRCYLAGVPIRIGISGEFGGQVLSHCIAPPGANVPDPHLYLLHACGLVEVDADVSQDVSSALTLNPSPKPGRGTSILSPPVSPSAHY